MGEQGLHTSTKVLLCRVRVNMEYRSSKNTLRRGKTSGEPVLTACGVLVHAEENLEGRRRDCITLIHEYLRQCFIELLRVDALLLTYEFQGLEVNLWMKRERPRNSYTFAA